MTILKAPEEEGYQASCKAYEAEVEARAKQVAEPKTPKKKKDK